MSKMETPSISLHEILCNYLSKEQVQDLLREYGEKVSGTKEEVIDRFFDSERVRKRTRTL